MSKRDLFLFIYFFKLVNKGSITSRRWRPPDRTEFRFHGWNGHRKVQKHKCGSFFSFLSGQDKCTQCIKEFSPTILPMMMWMLHRQTQRVDTEVILRQFTHLHHQPTVCKENGMNSFVSFFSFSFDLYVLSFSVAVPVIIKCQVDLCKWVYLYHLSKPG